jgi:ABC-type dipeptide/oligopeptide/nickel transport system permease component
VIQATTLLIALSFVLANIVVDLINASLNPRLREA